MLRVVAGSAGGLRLDAPKKYDIRPTQDRIKQVIFSSLGERVIGARVLDLYAGTGGLGIEALSRGAAEAVFVEENREAVECIKGNLKRCRLEGIVVQKDVIRLLAEQKLDTFDLIFADPPYEKIKKTQIEVTLAEKVRPWLKKNGVFIWEHFWGQIVGEVPHFKVIRDRKYGETGLIFLELSD